MNFEETAKMAMPMEVDILTKFFYFDWDMNVSGSNIPEQ